MDFKRYFEQRLSKHIRTSQFKLKLLLRDIDDYFSYVLTSTEAKEPKPSPMPYLQAMEFLSLNPNQTLIIEDSKTGLLSGIKSNAIVFGLTTSLNEDKIKKISNNIRIANSYTDIEIFLKNYNGQK